MCVENVLYYILVKYDWELGKGGADVDADEYWVRARKRGGEGVHHSGWWWVRARKRGEEGVHHGGWWWVRVRRRGGEGVHHGGRGYGPADV